MDPRSPSSFRLLHEGQFIVSNDELPMIQKSLQHKYYHDLHHCVPVWLRELVHPSLELSSDDLIRRSKAVIALTQIGHDEETWKLT